LEMSYAVLCTTFVQNDTHEIGWEDYLQNDLLYVELDIKL